MRLSAFTRSSQSAGVSFCMHRRLQGFAVDGPAGCAISAPEFLI